MDDEELIQRLARAHLHRRVEAHRRERRPARRRSLLGRIRRRARDPDRPTEDRERSLDALKRELEEAENRGRLPTRIEAEARALLARAGAALEEGPFEFLCSELLRVEHWAHRIAEQERVAERAGEPRPALPADAPAPGRPAARTRPPAPSPAPAKPLSEVIEAFVAWHEEKDWTPKTAALARAELAQLVEIVGEKPVGDVTPGDLERYRSVLQRLPARLGVRYKGRSIAQVLAEEPEPGLSAASIRKRLRRAEKLFDFAEQREWIEGRSPAREMELRAKGRGARERRSASGDGARAALRSARPGE